MHSSVADKKYISLINTILFHERTEKGIPIKWSNKQAGVATLILTLDKLQTKII